MSFPQLDMEGSNKRKGRLSYSQFCGNVCLVSAWSSFSKIILLVLPLCCSPPECNLRAESRFVQSEKKRWLDAGQLAQAVGKTTAEHAFWGCSLPGLLQACTSWWCLHFPWAQDSWAFQSSMVVSRQVRRAWKWPSTPAEDNIVASLPVWLTWGAGRERNTKKCPFLVLVCRSDHSHCILATVGDFWSYIGKRQPDYFAGWNHAITEKL